VDQATSLKKGATLDRGATLDKGATSSRAILALMVADGLLFLATAAFGFLVAGAARYAQHFVLALMTLVVTVLIHVVVFTYLTATFKMMSQAVHLGRLDDAALARAKVFKRRVARWVGLSFVTLLPVIAFGALSDRDASWGVWHFASACLTVVVHVAAFAGEYHAASANARLMADVFDAYNVRRRAQATR
jgi:hypothetical protein